MKFKNFLWLAKANVRRGKRSNTILTMMIIGLTALITILSINISLTNFLNTSTASDDLRRLRCGPYGAADEVMAKAENIDHVLAAERVDNIPSPSLSDILSVTDENGNKIPELLKRFENPHIKVRSLFKSQKAISIKGQQLDNSGSLTCVVPKKFYFSDSSDDNYPKDINNSDTFNGEDFIGKTINLRTSSSGISTDSGTIEIPPTEYSLKVVGVVDNTAEVSVDVAEVLISPETGKALEEQFYKNFGTDSDEYKALKDYNDNKSFRVYTVLVDDYSNVDAVSQALEDMGIENGPMAVLDPTLENFINVFNIASRVFVFCILALAVFNIYLAVSNALVERKGEIGLLKAIGYTNKDVFFSLYLEQLKISIKSLLISAVVSVVVLAVYNFIQLNGEILNSYFVTSVTDSLLLFLTALVIAVIVPLICQLITLRKLTKIQPGQAMSV